MRKRRKIDVRLLVLSGLMVFVLFANILFVGYYRNNRLGVERSYTDNLLREYDIALNVYADMADSIYHFYIDVPEIKRLFYRGVNAPNPEEKDRYRNMLFETLSDVYQRIRKYDFRQLHFHEPNNRSYLRFHRPGKYGDDLTEIRYSVAYVNRGKKYIRGFEEGAIFNGYRFVYPLSIDGLHIGSVEVSVSINSVIRKLTENFHQESQFIILKSQVLKKVFTSELSNYIPWYIDDTFFMDRELAEKRVLKTHLSDKDQQLIRDAIGVNMGRNTPFIVEVEAGSIPRVITFMPITNFLNEEVAYLFTLSDNKRFRELDRHFRYFFPSQVALLVLLIVFTVYYYLSQRKIENMATYDALTRVYARGPFLQLVSAEFRRYLRYQSFFSIIMIDVDHFKKVNDQFGHQSGDAVLARIASIMRRNLRETDVIGRYGGEEFLVLLPETQAENAVAIAEKLREIISLFDFHSVGRLTISCGVATVTKESRSVDELIATADQKLYLAKNSGRNQVVS